MIKFSNEEVRQRFHELPLEKQSDWNAVAEMHFNRGFQLHILFVERDENGTLEISIRVDEKFNNT